MTQIVTWEKKDNTTRFLLNDLPPQATEDVIRTHFGVFAQIAEVTLKHVESTGKNLALVRFATPTAKLRDQMLKNTHEILMTPIQVQALEQAIQQYQGDGPASVFPETYQPRDLAASGDAGLIDTIVPEVLAKIGESPKVGQGLRDVLREACGAIRQSRSLKEGIEKYAGTFVERLFIKFGDADWLWAAGQINLIVALVDAGIKDLFPADLLWTTEQKEFECMVIRTCTQHVDRKRIEYAVNRAIHSVLSANQRRASGKKASKKDAIWTAVYGGWEKALALGTSDREKFVSTWISSCDASALKLLLDSSQATRLFQTLLDACGLPVAIAPGPVDGLEESVRAAYGEGEPPEKRRRLEGPLGR